MVEGARFEIVWAAMSRGFESPLLHQLSLAAQQTANAENSARNSALLVDVHLISPTHTHSLPIFPQLHRQDSNWVSEKNRYPVFSERSPSGGRSYFLAKKLIQKLLDGAIHSCDHSFSAKNT